jgi:hypothetical protein
MNQLKRLSMSHSSPNKCRFLSPAHWIAFALIAAVDVGSAPIASAEIVLQEFFEFPLPGSNLVQHIISAVGTQGETITGFSEPTITAIGPGFGIHNVAQAVTNADTPTRDEHLPGGV